MTKMTEEEKIAAIQTKGAYKMLGGACVSIFVTPFMFVYSALTYQASLALMITGGVLIGSSFATKAIDNGNKPGMVKSFANQATKYLGEYGAKAILAGVAIQYPLYMGIAYMVEGAGNIITGKDSLGIIPSANWVSQEIGKYLQGNPKVVQQETSPAQAVDNQTKKEAEVSPAIVVQKQKDEPGSPRSIADERVTEERPTLLERVTAKTDSPRERN